MLSFVKLLTTLELFHIFCTSRVRNSLIFFAQIQSSLELACRLKLWTAVCPYLAIYYKMELGLLLGHSNAFYKLTHLMVAPVVFQAYYPAGRWIFDSVFVQKVFLGSDGLWAMWLLTQDITVWGLHKLSTPWAHFSSGMFNNQREVLLLCSV